MKNKRTLRVLAFVLLTLIISSMLCACGSSENAKGDFAVSEQAEGYLTDDSLSTGSTADGDGESTSVKDTRKIIETIYYSVQTKNFDKFVSALESKALSVGGYIEQSDVSGNAYEDVTSRYATYTFRIPADKVDEFTNTVSENSTITNRTVNTEDVTLKYVDVESRIKALKVEKESLEELLASATSTTEIIEIRDMLTDVIYEIETYESQLRTFDNLIDYTTITVDVDEVEHPIVVHEQTTWERIGTNLADNFRSLWDFLVELFVFVVSALPFILFIGVIVAIIIVIIKFATRRSRKRAKSKNTQNEVYPVPYYAQPPVVNTTQDVNQNVENNDDKN